MQTDEAARYDVLRCSRETAEGLVARSQQNLSLVSKYIVDANEGRRTRIELITLEKDRLGLARSERLQAAMLALTASRRYVGSVINPQKFTAGISERSLVHTTLEDHYQVASLIDALAREDVSVYDFGNACGIQREHYKEYLEKLDQVKATPEEVQGRDLWRAETAAMVSELETYQQVAATILTKTDL